MIANPFCKKDSNSVLSTGSYTQVPALVSCLRSLNDGLRHRSVNQKVIYCSAPVPNMAMLSYCDLVCTKP